MGMYFSERVRMGEVEVPRRCLYGWRDAPVGLGGTNQAQPWRWATLHTGTAATGGASQRWRWKTDLTLACQDTRKGTRC